MRIESPHQHLVKMIGYHFNYGLRKKVDILKDGEVIATTRKGTTEHIIVVTSSRSIIVKTIITYRTGKIFRRSKPSVANQTAHIQLNDYLKSTFEIKHYLSNEFEV